MKVSIVIPTYNEDQDLKNCIDSLISQNYSDFEIIVVDDGSTDSTLEVLSVLKKRLKKFSYYTQNHLGAGAARNKGAKQARGEILVFVDADMTFDSNFIKKLTLPIVKGLYPGTFSDDEFVSNWDNKWARCWNINEGWAEMRRHPKNHPDLQPVFRAILRSEFSKVNGFTPGGYNDDWSLSQKLGYKAARAVGAIFYHKNPSTLLEAYSHARWVGKRNYKLAYVGTLIALLRSSFFISIVVGFVKAVVYKNIYFLPFKVVYDLGLFTGILEYALTSNGAK